MVKKIFLMTLLGLLPLYMSAQYVCGKCYDQPPDSVNLQIDNDSLKLVVVTVIFKFFEDSVSIKEYEIYSVYTLYDNDTSQMQYHYEIDWSGDLMSKIHEAVVNELKLYRCWVYPGSEHPQKKLQIFYQLTLHVNQEGMSEYSPAIEPSGTFEADQTMNDSIVRSITRETTMTREFVEMWSQRYTCDEIEKLNLDEIHDELIKVEIYSVEEANCFGERISNRDSANGKKQVLTYHGPFTTGCLKCLYYKYGFVTHEFAPNDLRYETIDAFISAYNGIMESILTLDQKEEINGFNYRPDEIFTAYATTKNEYVVEMVNDSILTFRMYSDVLESLFGSDIEYLIIVIGDSINDTNARVLKYLDLKTDGVLISIDTVSELEMYITYDFSGMPNRYDLCWCGVLEHKYHMVLPLKI